jgi:hypothetical protein
MAPMAPVAVTRCAVWYRRRMRWVAVVLIAACTRAPDRQRDLDAALDCAAARVAAQAAAEHDFDLVPRIIDTIRDAAVPRPIAIRALRRIEAALSHPVDIAHAALGLAEQGDLPEAREAARRAGSALDRDPTPANRDNAVEHIALVVAWAGDPALAEKLAGGQPMAVLAVAQGAARAGNRAAADHALGQADTEPDDGGMLRAQRIDVLASLDRIAEADKLLATEANPNLHFYDATQLARNAMIARAPETTALLRAAVDESARIAAGVSDDDRLTWFAHRIELAGELEQHGDHADATALRAAIAADISPGETDVLSGLAFYAELAHAPAEADAYLARMRHGSGAPADARISIAALRGRFADAIAQLREPESNAEMMIFVWERLASHATPQLAADLRKAACAK